MFMKIGLYHNYVRAVKDINEDLDPDLILLAALFLASTLLLYLGLFYDIFLGFLIALVILDLVIGYPMYKLDKKIKEMEARLPDVLMHMATSLKAGGTIESSLKEVAGGRYGILAKEMRRMLLQMKEGKTFDEAFKDFADRSGSQIIRRTAEVIISARRSGGGLATALMSIADDVREMQRISKERIAKTTTYVMFVVIAADFVAPMIFGLVTGVMMFLAKVAGSSATPLFQSMIFYFKAYLAISAVFSALAAAMIREGDISKASLYAPFLLLLTYIIYQVVSGFAIGFFG